MLILMYLLDRIIMILILKIMTLGDGDTNDNVDKKIKIETIVYGNSVYIDFPRSWRPLIVEPISKNSMMVAQLKTQKRTKCKTWQKSGVYYVLVRLM